MEHELHALLAEPPREDFARGLEIGRLWEQLRCYEPVEQHVHVSNAALLLQISTVTHRRLKADALDATWLVARFDAPSWSAPHPPVLRRPA